MAGKTKRFLSAMTVPLGVVQDPKLNIQTRILLVYHWLGGTSRSFAVLSAEELTTLIGEPASKVDTVGRTRRKLESSGQLVKVRKVTKGGTIWGWVVTPARPLTAESIAVAQSKTGAGIVWVNPDCGSDSNLPRLLPLTVAGVEWWEHFPGLVDLEAPGIRELWAVKVPRTLATKDHPLRGIEDTNLRINTAMALFARRIARNIEDNPEWKPRDPVAWMLFVLTREIPKVDTPENREAVREIWEEWHTDPEGPEVFPRGDDPDPEPDEGFMDKTVSLLADLI